MEANGCWRRSLAVAASCVSCLAGASALAGEVEPGGISAPRVRITGAPGDAARRAVVGARLRLLEPSCSALLSEFSDASGQTLQVRLDALGLSAAEYLGVVLFVEGSNQAVCATGDVLGGTQPGSRVVALCGTPFAETERKNARLAESIIIHEMFHSLGLGENPPSSQEITTRVLQRCQERAAVTVKTLAGAAR